MESKIIHPYIWRLVERMYRHCYENDEELEQLFKLLDLKIPINEIKFYKLNKLLIKLSIEDGLKILQDLLEINDFWLTDGEITEIRNNDIRSMNRLRNLRLISGLNHLPEDLDYSPPEYKTWGMELVKQLQNKCGILYDRSAKAFSFVGVSDLRILPHIGKEFNTLINKKFDDHFYDSLISEINRTYLSSLYTSTMILCRKLVENMIIDILRLKYPPNEGENLDLYFDQKRGKTKDLYVLLESLTSKESDFFVDKPTFTRFVTRTNQLKQEANDNAHNLTIVANREDIAKLNIQETIELALRLKETKIVKSN